LSIPTSTTKEKKSLKIRADKRGCYKMQNDCRAIVKYNQKLLIAHSHCKVSATAELQLSEFLDIIRTVTSEISGGGVNESHK